MVTDGTPGHGSISASFAAGGADLTEVADQLRAAGADVNGPFDTLWFTTDVSFMDGDGNTVILTAPRAADQAHAWASNQISGDFEVPEGFSFDDGNQ